MTTHPNPRNEPPSAQEIRSILAGVSRNPAHRDLYDLALIVATTGIRPGELYHLKWTEVDLDARSLQVLSSKSAVSRRVPFGPTVLERLIQRHAPLADTRFLLGARPDSLLRAATSRIGTASETTCGRRISLHRIRSFFFLQWVSLGGDSAALAQIAGWSMARHVSFKVFGNPGESAAAADLQEQIEKLVTS